MTEAGCGSLLAGTIVGSGIFTSPGVVLLDAGSVGLGLMAWVAASFLALCSSLVYAELGAAIPKAGGNAEFLRVCVLFTWLTSQSCPGQHAHPTQCFSCVLPCNISISSFIPNFQTSSCLRL
jgi:hypothetical protein